LKTIILKDKLGKSIGLLLVLLARTVTVLAGLVATNPEKTILWAVPVRAVVQVTKTASPALTPSTATSCVAVELGKMFGKSMVSDPISITAIVPVWFGIVKDAPLDKTKGLARAEPGSATCPKVVARLN
jgi:hypothetical protein